MGFVKFLTEFYDLTDKKILDYGCGIGIFTDLFANVSDQVSGCDLSEENLNLATKLTKDKISYFKDDFFDSKLSHDTYDFIFCRNLGPMQKIDYTEEYAPYLKKIINSLTQDGVAYFILMHNFTNKAGENFLTQFRNHGLSTIFSFFSRVGHISMINCFGYQVVVVTRNVETAAKYNNRMFQIVMSQYSNLQKIDEIGIFKCYSWLYVNSVIDLENVQAISKFTNDYCNTWLKRGLIKLDHDRDQGQTNTDARNWVNYPFFISGDHDNTFDQRFIRQMTIDSMMNKNRLFRFLVNIYRRFKRG